MSDPVAATELQLHIDNDFQLMRSVAEPNYRNLERKLVAGKFDEERALKAMLNVATAGAHSYATAYATRADATRIFPIATRRECARLLLDAWRAEIDAGNGWLARERL